MEFYSDYSYSLFENSQPSTIRALKSYNLKNFNCQSLSLAYPQNQKSPASRGKRILVIRWQSQIPSVIIIVINSLGCGVGIYNREHSSMVEWHEQQFVVDLFYFAFYRFYAFFQFLSLPSYHSDHHRSSFIVVVAFRSSVYDSLRSTFKQVSRRWKVKKCASERRDFFSLP